MPRWKPGNFEVKTGIAIPPKPTRGRSPRLDALYAQSMRRVLQGLDALAAAKEQAPKHVGKYFFDWPKERKEEKIKAIRREIESRIVGLSDEDRRRILQS